MGDWDVVSHGPGEWDVVPPPYSITTSTGNTLEDGTNFASTVGHHALAMTAAAPYAIAHGLDWLGSKVGVNVGAEASMKQQGMPDYPGALGMTYRDLPGKEYVPQTTGGKMAMDAGTGALQAAMTLNPKALISGAGSAVAAGAAARNFPGNDWLPYAAALLGGPAANLAVSTPLRAGQALMGGSPNETYGAFKRLELPTNLSGTTTGDPGLLNAEKFAARMPGSEGVLAAQRENLVTGWQDKLNKVAGGLGSATTPTELGTTLQSNARNWLSDFKTRTGQMWSDFYSQVPPTTQVQPANYETALNNVLGNFKGAPASGSVLQPNTVKALSDALGVDLGAGKTLSWDALKNIRSAIGERLENPQPISDTSQAALKQLYGGLTRDMETGAASVSPNALSAFHRANAATAAGHSVLDDFISPVLKAQTPEQAAAYALGQSKQGGSRVGALTFNMPGTSGDMASYALRNAATNTESPTAFSNAMDGRRPALSPEAKSILFSDPKVRQAVEDLSTTGRAMIPAERDLANSPTATHMTRGLGRLMAAGELAREGHDIAGWPGALAGGSVGLFAPNIMGKAAQTVALNPTVAALYGHSAPLGLTSQSLLARYLMMPAISGMNPGQLPQGGMPALPAPSPAMRPN